MKTKINTLLNALLLFAALLAFTTTKAQIFYTDIAPDTIISIPSINGSSSLNIDIDDDKIIDFLVFAYRANATISTAQLNIQSKVHTNNRVVLGGGGWPENVISHNDTIGPFTSWYPSSVYRYWCYGFQSDVGEMYNIPEGDFFCGIKITHNDSTINYGWLKVNHISTYSAKIYDYAVNLTPNEFILAGQTTVYTKNSAAAVNTPIFTKNRSNIYIDYHKQNTASNLKIIDLSGRLIYGEKFEQFPININVEGFQQGFYIMQLEINHIIFCQKFLL